MEQGLGERGVTRYVSHWYSMTIPRRMHAMLYPCLEETYLIAFEGIGEVQENFD